MFSKTRSTAFSIRSKDKAVAKNLKAKLDAHREESLVEETRFNNVEKIVVEMEKLAGNPWQPGSVNRFDSYDQQWQQLGHDPSEEQKQRFERAHADAEKNANEWRAKQTLQTQRDDILKTLETTGILLKPYPAPDSENAGDFSLKDLKTQWASLTEQQPPSEIEAKRFAELTSQLQQRTAEIKTCRNAERVIAQDNSDVKALQNTQKALQALTDSPNDLPAKALLDQINAKIGKKEADTKVLQQQIKKQLSNLKNAIDRKSWGPARSIRDRVKRKIAALETTQRGSFDTRFKKLSEQVDDLGDWQEFASKPKLIKLCEQMEALPAQKLSPDDCAKRIKDLQTSWKAMGASPALQELWPRFKTASDTAYAPCGEYFAKRRQEKEAKLEKRREICEMLEQYANDTDWENADFKLVEKTLRTAKREWKNSQVFDRKKGKKLDDRFTKVLQLIDEKLTPQYSAHAEEKKALIEKVIKLGEGDISQHTVNQVKSLQSAWRLSGVCRAKDDRELWNEFSGATKKIFDEFHSKRREQEAAGKEHITRAREIVKTLFNLSKSKETISDKQLGELQAEYEQLPEMPERDRKHIGRDYRKALNAVDKQRLQAQQQHREQSMQTLQHNAEICSALEQLAESDADNKAEIDRLIADWIDSDQANHAEANKSLKKRRQSIIALLEAKKQPDYESNTQKRRLLCIELEILRDKETPAEDKALRMQYQLERLQQGLQSSEASETPQAQIEKLKIAWLTAPSAAPAWVEKLDTRFKTALD